MMPRDGSNIYHTPPGTQGISNTTIASTPYNGYLADIAQDLNLPRPIVAGGTGANNAATALTNLGGEKSGQVVTNYDSFPFVSGSFYSAAGATGAPSGNAQRGIAYVTDANNMTVEARDATTALKYVRQKTAGTWGAWGGEIVSSPLYVAKTGDTMSGDLKIAVTAPDLILSKASGTAGTQCNIWGQTNNVVRWLIQLGNEDNESGSNNGSNFTIQRYSDGGSFIDSLLSINRSSGTATFNKDVISVTNIWAHGGRYNFNSAGSKSLLWDGSSFFNLLGGSLNIVNGGLTVSGGGISASSITASGGITASSTIAANGGLTASNITASGTVAANNITSSGGISASGNIAANGGITVNNTWGYFSGWNSAGADPSTSTNGLTIGWNNSGGSQEQSLINTATGGQGGIWLHKMTGPSSKTLLMRLDTIGIFFPTIGTTVQAANAYLDGGTSPQNGLSRSTSSLRYKRDVEPVDQERMNAALAIKPIWFRSKAAADNPRYSFYGMGAEEVAAIDPRLVHWAYLDSDRDEHGHAKPGAQLVPEGVAYDRVAILQIAALTKALQEAMTRIEALEARAQ